MAADWGVGLLITKPVANGKGTARKNWRSHIRDDPEQYAKTEDG